MLINTVTSRIEESRPSVFITCTVCSFHPDGTNCSFCLTLCWHAGCHSAKDWAFSLSVSLFTPMEKFHTTSGAVSKRGEGVCACVEGGRCDVSMVKTTVETMTWAYLAITLVEFVPPPFLRILCLTVTVFGVAQPAFKANFMCIFPSYY